MKFSSLHAIPLVLVSSAAFFFACSSNDDPPNNPGGRSDSGTTSDGSAIPDTGTPVGQWPCYPELGDYTVTYTLVDGGAEDCPALDPETATILEWNGPLGSAPGCTLKADEAQCLLAEFCEQEYTATNKTVATITKFAKGEDPPVSGQRQLVTTVKPYDAGTGDAGVIVLPNDGGVIILEPPQPPDGLKNTECVYSFDYAKK